MSTVELWQWGLVIASSAVLFALSPMAKNTNQFFKAVYKKKAPSTFMLMGSLVISWIFAKSITNAANLGLEFGIVGGVAYSAYYLSFIVAGIIIYQMRTKGNFKSIHHFLSAKFGKGAVAVFSILIAIRLFNEVWSNTMVIGSYFGTIGSSTYYWAILAYPFHDPVMTDRGFLSSPKVTLRSFLLASVVGGLCIILFSVIGVYAQSQQMSGQAAVEVGKAFGLVVLLVINFIMITSAASTLDSTFSSFSKLLSVDLNLGDTLKFGRWSMVIIAVLGTIPVFFDAEILSATTISGTMVIGLTPIFVFWKTKAPRISFHLSVFCGLLFGLLLVFKLFPSQLLLTSALFYSDMDKKIAHLGTLHGKVLVFGGVYSNLQALEALMAIAKNEGIAPENCICTG